MTKETFFISHGSPMLSIDDSLAVRHFLKSWKEKVYPHTPNSILVISAHWETDVPAVNAISPPKVNDTIHDFYNFPEPMYQLKYPAPGAAQLAKRVKDLLLASGLDRVDEDNERGLDHGAWIPLMLMYPEAQIPVCQLAVQTQKDATYHYNLGRALAPLKDEDVLILGSGTATHNLTLLSFTNETLVPWAVDFDTWLRHALEEGRYEDVNKYLEKAPYAKIAHPRPEHFYPLHVALGAAGDDAKAKLIHHSWTNGCVSYASYQFTTTH